MLTTRSKQILIGITGVPGTGKTTLAKHLCKAKGWRLISLTDFARSQKTVDLIKDEYWDTNLVDPAQLELALRKELTRFGDQVVVIEGHLLPEMRLPLDYVIVLRCSPHVLRKRLEQRGYSGVKIQTNIDAEMIDYCGYFYENPFYIDTTQPVEQSIEQLLRFIGGQKMLNNL